MVSSLTCIFLTACSTAEKVDQALIIAVKFMVDFVTFCSSKTVSVTFMLSGYNLDLTMQSFIFLALLYEAIGGCGKTF